MCKILKHKAGIDLHRFAAVVYGAGEVVVVQFGIVWEEGGQHHIDGKAARKVQAVGDRIVTGLRFAVCGLRYVLR